MYFVVKNDHALERKEREGEIAFWCCMFAVNPLRTNYFSNYLKNFKTRGLRKLSVVLDAMRSSSLSYFD